MKNINRRLQKIYYKGLRFIQAPRYYSQTLFDYQQISQLFNESSFLPFSAWAISPSTILHVLNDITLNKRENIIEFGSGASTIYIAKLIKFLGREITFYSVESDKIWAEDMNNLLKLHKLDSFANIIYAPLVPVSPEISFAGQHVWYDSEVINREITEVSHFDLILVDGPGGITTPYARYSVVPFLKNRLAQDFIIYLDDTDRYEEQKILTLWKGILACQTFSYAQYSTLVKGKSFDIVPYKLRFIRV